MNLSPEIIAHVSKQNNIDNEAVNAIWKKGQEINPDDYPDLLSYMFAVRTSMLTVKENVKKTKKGKKNRGKK